MLFKPHWEILLNFENPAFSEALWISKPFACFIYWEESCHCILLLYLHFLVVVIVLTHLTLYHVSKPTYVATFLLWPHVVNGLIYFVIRKPCNNNEAFQGVEAIGNIALKTGKILSESTNNQQKKRKELWQQQQTLFHYFQTFPVIFFGLFPNYSIARERSLERQILNSVQVLYLL